MKAVGRIIMLLASLVIRPLLSDLLPTWILRATLPLRLGLCSAAFSSRTLAIFPAFCMRKFMTFFWPALSSVEEPRSETLELSSGNFYSAVDTVDNFF
jgi:hypothetical protein